MKKFSTLSIFLFLFVISACSSSIPTTTRPANESDSSNQARPTPTSLNQPNESTDLPMPYPGIPATAVSNPEGYPAAQEIYPTIDPYPADASTVWLLHPVGVQCEDTSTSKYQSEQDVKAGLTAAGFTVYDVTTTDMMVCQACGCPTSIHYRVEINEADLNKAIALGWTQE
jgi:hypothetical protein